MEYESDREMLAWHGEDNPLSEEMNIDIPKCLWNGVTSQNEDVSCYMFDDATPVKTSGGLMYPVPDNVYMDKEAEEMNDPILQVKRRRMLQFQNEVMPSVFLKTKDREDSSEEAFSGISQWVSSFSENSSGHLEIDQSSEEWIADCFNNSETTRSPIDVSLPEASDVQINSSGTRNFCNNPPEHQATMGRKGCATRRRNIVFKGRKSNVWTTKMAPCVAYPFDIIKPCGYDGDTTLDDINKRLHSPSSSSRKANSEDPCASYPTSAFSGKLVVGKTTLHTDGGRGSITIMKTKG